MSPSLNSLIGLLNDRWLNTLIAAALLVALALLLHWLGALVVNRLTRGHDLATRMARKAHHPTLFLAPLVLLQLLWQVVPDDLERITGVRHVNGLLLIGGLTWLAARMVTGFAAGVVQMNPFDLDDNLQARRVYTQARVLTRMVRTLIVLVGLSLMLMTFPGVRQLGASLLASAGVLGIVVGLAARPAISNFIAGLQIALAQPIRIDDVLIILGEWGRVEEITGTYVVMRIWDERRMVIPLQWFMENPFQNWTRKSADLIGTVLLWVDYAMPLEPLREEARRACEAAPEWDGKLCMMQVTEAGERGMQLRFLVTSANAPRNWDLRCKVREALVVMMQRDYSQHLPRARAELVGAEMPGPGPATPRP